MLLENPPDMGTKAVADTENAPFPKVRRFMSDQEYYDYLSAKKEAEDAQWLVEVEPLVDALERRLHQENLFARVLVETGVKEEVLRALLDRRPPVKHGLTNLRSGDEPAFRDALGKLAAWLRGDAQRRKATPGHAPTPTLKAVYSILVEAMDYSLLSVIVGGPGMGKSFAAQTLVEERPRSIEQPGAVRVELSEDDRTVHKCIETLLKRLRHDTHGEGGYAGLCRALRPGDLLILDEAQRLATCGNGAMVEIVRDLWRDTGAGIVLIGNPHMRRGKTKIIGNDLYAAFLSRAEVHDLAQSNSRADVEAWMVWKGLAGKTLAGKLVQLATSPARGEPGNLRELEKLYQRTARRHPGEVVTAAMLLEASGIQGAKS